MSVFKTNVFVYGTLLSGERNNRCFEPSLIESVSPARVRGRMFVSTSHSSFPYLQVPLADIYRMGEEPLQDVPAWELINHFKGHLRGRPVLPEPNITPVEGEMFRLSGTESEIVSQLSRLDRLEGYSSSENSLQSMYLRLLTHCSMKEGKKEKVLTWIYGLPKLQPFAPSGYNQILHGDWRRFRKDQATTPLDRVLSVVSALR